MGGVMDHILNVDQGWLYLLVFALVFAEDALFFGFVIPGETAAVLAGVQAWRGHAYLSAVMIVVVFAAISGDSVGYEIGKKFGPRLMRTRMLRDHQQRLEQARDFLRRRGGMAVFFGRFVAFFRATMPALAGMSHMPYKKFLFFNAAGGIVWGVTFTTLGFQAGESYHKVEHLAGRGAAIAAAVVVALLLLVWKVRGHRAEKDPKPQVESATD